MAEVSARPLSAKDRPWAPHTLRESMKQCPDSAPPRRRHSMEQIDGKKEVRKGRTGRIPPEP